MKIIDAHTHTLVLLRGMRPYCESEGIDYSEEALKQQIEENDIERVLSIPDDVRKDAPTPIALREIMEQAKRIDAIAPVVSVNPHIITPAGLERTSKAIKNGDAKGLKLYLGYYHVHVDSPRYKPIYKIAERYEVPVILHSGDTFWRGRARRDKDGRRLPPRKNFGLLEFSHPSDVDRVASKYPNVDFVVAHLGNPQLRDAAELVWKNENVFLDISALVVGGDLSKNPYIERAIDDIRFAFDYIGDCRNILYGSDWPLARISDYLRFAKKAVPQKHWPKVSYENAKRVFDL